MWGTKGAPSKPRLPHSRSPPDITAGAATTEEDKGTEGPGRGRPAKRGNGPGGGGRRGSSGLPPPAAGGRDGGKPERSPPTCAYCVAKKKPPNPHYVDSCPWISAASHSDLVATLPNLCVGCLRQKKPPGSSAQHKCPHFLRTGVEYSFCPICKLHIKLCKSPTTHTRTPIPETFVGATVRLEQHEDREEASTWAYESINKGSLGSSTLMTSSLTLINGQDSIQIECLWDSGSESSFFSLALLPFATSQRNQSFK